MRNLNKPQCANTSQGVCVCGDTVSSVFADSKFSQGVGCFSSAAHLLFLACVHPLVFDLNKSTYCKLYNILLSFDDSMIKNMP